ncbi:hypothetical protein K1T71_014073 [Dendrolimus kikuchii]|uniref:Uncharacterized protein n=1 Tax=Dendrolimus kikuchii TaxID=765133 RepID=A0ACC1CEW8_9NEOP|nr:hypothetical protein K1T71_014073 [Dendrolimus kikuchii]
MIGKLFLFTILALAQGRQVQEEDIVLSKEDAICPKDIAFYLIPHETDCVKYYLCEYGMKYIEPWSCFSDTEFSVEEQACTYPSIANCKLGNASRNPTNMDLDCANCKMKVSKCVENETTPIERPLKISQEITGLEKLVEELRTVFSKDHVNVQDVQNLMAGYKSDPKDWRKYAKYDRFRYTRNLVDTGNGAFNIMILCWGPGHASPIHDHANSHCFMKLLSGSLEEIRYEWPDTVQPEVMKVLNKNNQTETNVEQLNEDVTELDISSCQNDSCQIDSCQCDRCQNNVSAVCEDSEEEIYNAQDMNEIGRTRLEVDDVCYINDSLGLHRMENPSHVDGAVSLHLYSPPFDSCRVFDARTGKPTEVKVTFWSMYGKKIKRVIDANHGADNQK